MSDKISELAGVLSKTMENAGSKKTSPYDTVATVTRVDEDGTAWVSIPGGVRETPAGQGTTVKTGDQVEVRVSGGRATIQGNYTAPPTDDTRANQAYWEALSATDSANKAASEASRAKEAADSATEDAAKAASAAGDADDAAKLAQTSADSASNSASLALNQLDVIENVVGVLELVSKRGNYQPTLDTEAQANKWYFTQESPPPHEEYAVVSNPSGDPSAQGWYELTGIDESVQNYVSSHLILDGYGLWLQTDGSSAKLQLSPQDGVLLYNENNKQVAQYGADTIIGNLNDPNGFRIKIDSNNNEIGFYEGDDSILANRIAYMSGYELYVRNRLSFGHFQFIERENGHFTLKLVD